MTRNNTDEQIRHVFDDWHRAVKDQDAEGMAAL
jgi:ketosteroid isomerase-like protein